MESRIFVLGNDHAENDDLEGQDKIQKIIELLNSDPLKLCDDYEAMKCYGALYPICEPALSLLKKIIEENDAK